MGSLARLCCAAVAILTLGTVFSDSYSVSAQLIISEFRVRGPNGANDEFIEIYNNSGANHTVAAATTDGSNDGYAVAASNGVARCVIPNGTVIPNRGHYLCTNSVGYSLAAYPAGNGTTASGDATYTTDIPDNAGIAIFNTSVTANFTLGNRMDAVGSTSEANTLYKEGTGYPALTPFSIDYSFYRDTCGKSGSITTFGQCPIPGLPKDTNNNAADFVFVDTNGTSAGAGQRLGAPGPENLSSPIPSAGLMTGTLIDATLSKESQPNRQRDGGAFCAPPNPVVPPCVPAQNSTFGTISFRRRITNNTGLPVTRLRFRIVDKTTFPAPSGIADMRARTSTPVVIATIEDPATCAAKVPPEAAPCSVTAQGTTLEQPPGQSNGGGFNSTLSAGTVDLATQLAPGASINVQFLYGLQQMGSFKIWVNIEVLTGVPDGGGAIEDTSGGETPNNKKQFSSSTSGRAAGSSGESGSVDSGAAPAVASPRPVIPNVWVINPETRRAVPARVARDVEPVTDEAEKAEGKKSENAPATSGQPAPPANEEPLTTDAAPAVAPATAPAVPTATTMAATSPSVRKEAANTAQARPLKKKGRKAVARKRGTLRRR